MLDAPGGRRRHEHLSSRWAPLAGLGDNIYNHFGQPDLLDDVTDHWSSAAHEKEKAELLTAVVEAAKARQFRVTVVAGDVHLCAVTYLKSRGAAGKVQATDPGFVPHIVTSAIGNKPPGDFVVKCAPRLLRAVMSRNHAAVPVLRSGNLSLHRAGVVAAAGLPQHELMACRHPVMCGRPAWGCVTCARPRPV